MSVGTAVGATFGAVIGFFVGGPAGALKGAQLGMTIGGIIDPPKGPSINGPRLTDLTLQSSSYNSVIAKTYGTVSITGNIIWLENNKLKEVETKTKSGGKGGGGGSEVTTYSYYGTFALALCRGPISGVRRIWIGSSLVYDAGSTNINTIIASNRTSKLFTLHTGTDTQLPDARMQATLGASNVPGYRGLAYLVFKDLPLKNYGNTLAGAQIKVEVVSIGETVSHGLSAITLGLSTAVAGVWDGKQFIVLNQTANAANYATSPDGITWTSRSFPEAAGASARCVICTKGGVTLAQFSEETGVWRTTNGLTWINAIPGPGRYNLSANSSYFFAMKTGGTLNYRSEKGSVWVPIGTVAEPASHKKAAINNDYLIRMSGTFANYFHVYDIRKGTWHTYTSPFTYSFNTMAWLPDVSKWFCMTQTNQCAMTADFVNWQVVTGPTGGWGELVYGDALYSLTNDQQRYTTDGVNWTRLPFIGPIICYGLAYTPGVGVFIGLSGGSMRMVVSQITSSSTTIRDIISSVVADSKIITSDDIDVTAMTQQVRGFRIGRVTALKTAIEPLQAAWPFDIIQSGYKIKFKPRTGTSVVTIPAKDLAARQGE